MKNKATHIGTCQICAHVQMLPNGVLANHGYNVEYGFGHVGTCRGSGHLPFEIDNKLATSSKEIAEQAIAEYEATNDTAPVASDISHTWYIKSDKNCSPEELQYRNDMKAYRSRVSLNNSRKEYVAWQKSRLANWSVKPLKTRDDEEKSVEAKKSAAKGIRLAARTRDDAKYAWSKACEKLRKVAGEYANRPFHAISDAAGNPNYDLYVDFPYEATNTSAKITAMARQHCQNAPEIVAMADEVDALLAAFKAAKEAHAALKNA